jgi:hypothetical protein
MRADVPADISSNYNYKASEIDQQYGANIDSAKPQSLYKGHESGSKSKGVKEARHGKKFKRSAHPIQKTSSQNVTINNTLTNGGDT